MRLWPYQMLTVLPYRQLLSQWRECLAVSGMIANDGINHATINRVKDYPIEHFAAYCDLVRAEFKRREWTIGTNTIEKLNSDIGYNKLKYKLDIKENNRNEIPCVTVDDKKLFENFHNERYIRQCVYSFQEKFDEGMIKEEEWNKIQERFDILMAK